MYRWIEPSHAAYSALTVALIGTSYVTPVSALILLGLWAQRIASTRRWACPHCGAQEAAAPAADAVAA